MLAPGLRNALKKIGVYGVLRSALMRARQLRSLAVRAGAVRRYLETHEVRKLQVGTGQNPLPGWLNTDLEPLSREIVYLDARRRSPLPDAAFDYVFSEHLIEHLSWAEGLGMLRECFRVLKPGGRVYIATPNLDFLVDLHRPDKTPTQQEYVAWSVDTWFPNAGPRRDATVINRYFKEWEHRFVYDFATLRDALAEAGFAGIVRRNYGESDDPNLKGLMSHHRHIPEAFARLETFVIEAVKPETA